LAFSRYRFRELTADLMKPSNIPAIMAVLVITVAGFFADYQNNLVHQQNLRSDVLADVSVIRAKLEGNVNGNLQLVRGLIAAISSEPNMSQQRFEQLASYTFQENSQLRSIAAAPDLVITMTYPLKGNERVIGLDYRTNEAQRDAALRVLETGRLVLAGPVDLVQGGRGFVGRFPVYVGAEPSDRRFWGLVSAVIDVERLYKDSGLLDEGLSIDIAIAGKDATGDARTQFFGRDGIFAEDPVTADVILPSGSWVMAAVPKTGWNTTPPGAWLLRAMVVLLGALVVFPIVVGGRLMEERQRNIRALGIREAELQRVSRRLSLALETSRVGVWEYDIASGALMWDDRMNEIYGLPADSAERSYSHWRDRLHPDDLERASEDFRIAAEVTGHYHSDYRIVTPDGEERTVRAIGRVYEDPGASPKIVGVNWDVTTDVALNDNLKRANRLSEARNAELEAAKARIEHNALHDSLTGLPNRRYLDDILRRHAQRCALNGRQLALLHIDLDRFKQINDTLGHAAGDAMLIHASEVLKSNIRADDFVARIGGDEFVVVCTADGNTAILAQLADRIITTMRQPVAYEGHECRFGVSVGLAVETGAQVDPNRLLINADIALYRAKSRGRNRYEFFTEALQAEVVRTKRMADEILHGLENAEFLPHYQPQFDAHTLDVVGAEALARWQHPHDGIVPPHQFLGVAEELNVVSTIDRMVLEQALRQFEEWREMGLMVPHVSVNVSARRLQDEQLISTLKGLKIRPGTVSFELVESIFLDESDDIVLFNIDQIKDLGIDIEIDDFGTGYASIVSLLKLKPKRLKIDRQLVMPIVESPAQRHLVASIIDIGKSLGIQVVGEGVETMEHAGILRDLGCDILQGYAFAHPMSAGELTAFLKASSWRRPALVKAAAR
jgi:diguanylate cyclase (GGDEF)-like protein/PAS domain S-box-containing protein